MLEQWLMQNEVYYVSSPKYWQHNYRLIYALMSRVILLLLYTLNWCTYCHCLHSMWGRVYKTVERPSVRLFVPSFHSRSSLQRVCYRVPRGQEISIVTRHWHSAATAPQHGAQQQMRAVSCWQPRDEAEHRFVRYIVHFYNDMLLCCWQLWNAKHAWLTVILLAVICSWHSFSGVHFVTAEGMLLCNFWHESVKIGIPHLHSWHHYSAMDGRISILMGALHWHWPLIELWRTLFQ